MVNSLGTIFFISVGMLVVIYPVVINGGSVAIQRISFLAFVFIDVGGLWVCGLPIAGPDFVLRCDERTSWWPTPDRRSRPIR